ncbi:MAG: cytochrome C [Desulfuromonadales bacterium]
MFRMSVLSFFLLLALPVCVLAGEVTYSKNIRPLFEARCGGCHGADAPEYPAFKADKAAWVARQTGPRMDTYAHLIYYTAWPDTGALMRRLDDAKPGNMYQYLGDNDAERQQNLLLFKNWVGSWPLKKWSEMTKEELDGIKVPY